MQIAGFGGHKAACGQRCKFGEGAGAGWAMDKQVAGGSESTLGPDVTLMRLNHEASINSTT